MSAIRPNKEQFIELMDAPDEGPVVMLNLLKFKAQADGRERQRRERVQQVRRRRGADGREARGGKVLWMGRADQTLIGDPTEDWDSVALVQYPSRKAFVEMMTTPEYEQAHEHRESGLERTVLIACTERVSRLPTLGS